MQPNNTYTLPLLLLLFLSAIGTTHAQFNTLTQKVAPEKEYQKFRVVENVPTVTNAEKKAVVCGGASSFVVRKQSFVAR